MKAGKELVAGDSLSAISLGDSCLQVREFFRRQMNFVFLLPADNHDVGSIDERRVVEHDFSGDDGFLASPRR